MNLKVITSLFFLIFTTSVWAFQTPKVVCDDDSYCPGGLGVASFQVNERKTKHCAGILLGSRRNYLLLSSSCLDEKLMTDSKSCKERLKVNFAQTLFQDEEEVGCKKIVSSRKNTLGLFIVELDRQLKRTPIELSTYSIYRNSIFTLWSLNFDEEKNQVGLKSKKCRLLNNYWAKASINSNEDGQIYMPGCTENEINDGAAMMDSDGLVRAIYRTRDRTKISFKRMYSDSYKMKTKNYKVKFAQDASCINILGSSFKTLIVSSNCPEEKTFTSRLTKFIGQRIPAWMFEEKSKKKQ